MEHMDNSIGAHSESSSNIAELNNPNYLNGCYLNTISKLNEQVNLYKRMVSNNNLQLVRKKSAYQRNMWIHCHQTKHKPGDEHSAGNYDTGDLGMDPLTLIPVEMWTMILSQITKVQDLLHLSRTCHLFQEIVNNTKNLRLFTNVFPYLFNYLSREEILKCRLVCKQWSCSVDTFLQNYKLLKPHFPLESLGTGSQPYMKTYLENPNIQFKPFPFDYTFMVPFCQNTRAKLLLLESLGLHSKDVNPFIGRSVTLQMGSTFPEAEIHERLQQFMEQTKMILKQFDKHIWHFSIKCCSRFQWPKLFWFIINYVLKNCVNLKSLQISHKLWWSYIPGLNFVSVDRPSLENITIDTYCRDQILLQNKLVSKFSGQLKRFEVQVWHEEKYRVFDWGNLLDLQINNGNIIKIVESLKKSEKMGNLRKLSICINDNGKILKELVKLTRKFAKLTELKLKFEGRCGTALKQLCEERLFPGVMGSSNLISLEIESKSCEVVSYEFLLYFPYLIRVTIKHCHRRVDRERQVVSTFINQNGGNKEWEGILNIGKYLTQKMNDNTG